MRVFRIKGSPGGPGPTYDNIEDLLQDVRLHCIEGDVPSAVVVEIKEMSREEYNELPEFKGY